MTAVSVCVVLGLLMALLIKTKGLGPGSAVVAVLFGLTLAATPAGPAVHDGLDSVGGWLWSNGTQL